MTNFQSHEAINQHLSELRFEGAQQRLALSTRRPSRIRDLFTLRWGWRAEPALPSRWALPTMGLTAS
jgi:hypothetical protein